MNVKELIVKLMEFDMDNKVYVWNAYHDAEDDTVKVELFLDGIIVH